LQLLYFGLKLVYLLLAHLDLLGELTVLVLEFAQFVGCISRQLGILTLLLLLF
jgi:hypothetical protein